MAKLAVCRLTGPVDRGRSRSTDVHRTCTQPGLVGRSTVQRALLSGNGLGRPGRSIGRELCSLYPVSVDRAGRPEAQRSEIWPLGRSTGRSIGRPNLPLAYYCQRAEFYGAINTPPFELVFNKFFKSKILILSSVLLQVFKRVFGFKDFIFICFKGLEKIKKKKSLWD